MQMYINTTKTKKLKPWQGIIFGILFIIIGSFLLINGFNKFKEYNEKKEKYIETTSVIVKYNYDDDNLMAIVVQYSVNGEYYEKASDVYSNVPQKIGDKVLIKYNPNDPSDAIWSKDSSNSIIFLIGSVFVLSGIIVVIINIRQANKNKRISNMEINNNLNNQTDISSGSNSTNCSNENNEMPNIGNEQVTENKQEDIISSIMEPFPMNNENEKNDNEMQRF